jgi:hypothetical protein
MQQPIYSPPKDRNTLGLVSFLLAMITPVAVGLIVIASILPGQNLLTAAFTLFTLLVAAVGFLAAPAAIITGHIAYFRAKRSPNELPRLGFAVAALIMGYVAVVLYALFVVVLIADYNALQPQGVLPAWLLVHS